MRAGRWLKTSTRWARKRASSTSCVTSSTEKPARCQILRISLCMASRVSESSLPSGSSRISRRGSLTRARARAARWAMPPDSWWGWLSAKSSSPTRRRASSMRWAWLSSSPRACRPRATLPRTVRQGNSVGSWKTTMREGSGSVMAVPSCATAPAVGASSPATRRSSVDLPQPLGPSRATNSPGRTCRLTSSSTCSAPCPWPNQWLTACTSMAAPARAAPAMAGVAAALAACSAAITI